MNQDSIEKGTGQMTNAKQGTPAYPPASTELEANEILHTQAMIIDIPAPADIKETSSLPHSEVLVLVVDDIVDNVVLLSLNLQKQGYKVVTASNGEEAVRVAELMRPQIILMDIGMPELDGLGATRKIREHRDLRNIPVVAVTAFATAGFRRAAYDVGFDGYLTKPIDFQQLHELMNRLLP